MSFPDDIISQILDSCGRNFLYVGTVNRQFYQCSAGRSTNISEVFSSRSKLLECLADVAGRSAISYLHPFEIVATSQIKANENIRIAECLLSNGFQWNPLCLNSALKSKNFYILNWVINRNLPWKPLEVLSSCVLEGDLDGMKHLYKWGFKPDKSVVGLAAECSNRDIIDWLIEVGCSVSNVVEIFASNGDLYSVVWANVRHGLLCTKKSLDAAALSGNEWLVDYMLNLSIEADITTLECACVGNSLATIELLQEKFPKIFDLVDFDEIEDLFARYDSYD